MKKLKNNISLPTPALPPIILFLKSGSESKNQEATNQFMAGPATCFLAGLLAISAVAAAAFPLSTDSRWIVDGGGRRVKLACVNWAAHMEAMVAEGLSKQPLDSVSEKISSMGFNCVRLTWALYMLTRNSSSSLTVRHSLESLGLFESAAAVQVNNPYLTDLSVVQAFQAVVWSLGRKNIMVILDNQISKPEWCCSKNDGNGFFGDPYFDPDEWILGLTLMATMFNGSSTVVGMSLRNELRGPNQNVTDWYRYMQRGAEAVHSANPNVLVILSGLDYDKDLSYLSQKQVNLTFNGKLVFELHWYGFSDGGDWKNGNPNQVCAGVVGNLTRKAGFLLNQGWPLFLGEFGVDQSGTNVVDNRFLSCLLGVAAEWDLDWAIWALQGSYYTREGILGYDESYGLLAWDWCKVRNPNFLQRIAALQSPFQGPGLSHNSQYKVLFHPLTGLCVLRNPTLDQLILGYCAGSEAWDYTEQQALVVEGADLCLQAEGLGKPAKLGTFCGNSYSKWELVSDSKMHISSKLSNNDTVVCLGVDPDGTIITDLCVCINREDRNCDPDHQWFKIVSSTRNQASLGTFWKRSLQGIAWDQ